MRNALLPFYIAFLLSCATVTGCSGSGDPVAPPPVFASLALANVEVVAAPPLYSYDPKVAVSPVDGEVFCCYVRKTGEAPEVYWRHGQPGSLTTEEIITPIDGVRSFNPVIRTAPDGAMHFAWQNRIPVGDFQKEIFAKSWIDGEWTGTSELSIPDNYTGWDPDMAVYPDGRPVVCWFDHMFGIQHEILVSVGDGNGSWSSYHRLTDDNHWQYYPNIDIGPDGTLHLVYVDTRELADEWFNPDHYREGTNLEIYYRTWDGVSTGPETRITNTGLRSRAPQIAVGITGVAHVIWLDETETGYYRLYHRAVDDGQAGPINAVSSYGTRSDQSDIAVLDERIYIVYPQFVDPAAPPYSDSRLLVREVKADGSMGVPLVVAGSGCNMHPRITPDQYRDCIWVIWTEYSGDDESLVTGESSVKLARITVENQS
jgi:hypothetical protein